MANFRRSRPRHLTRSRAHCHYPKWWDVVFHTRPRRRRESLMLRKVVIGAIDADNAVWPLEHKPHKYYW